MRLILMSDTHLRHTDLQVPDGDVLIHCGDAGVWGKEKEYIKFEEWSQTLPHKDKFFVPGNHDFLFERDFGFAKTLIPSWTVLLDELVPIHGELLFASPWTPEFFNWAFMKSREELWDVWKRIPQETTILITHGPPYGIMDQTRTGEYAGDKALRERIKELPNLKLHAFGHIHEGRGEQVIGPVRFINAACCTPTGVMNPVVVDV